MSTYLLLNAEYTYRDDDYIVCLFETEVCLGGNSAGSDRGSYANPYTKWSLIS